jgi:hypothetical protein
VRRINSYFFISLDGVVEAPDKWHFPYFDDEMGEAVGAGFATPAGRADRPARAAECANLQDRRAELELRPGPD